MLRYFLLVALLASPGNIDDGRKDGRRGNKQYEDGNHEAAAAAYRAGLSAYAEVPEPGDIHTGLLNNLGAALYENASYMDAKDVFDAAINMAPDAASVARAAYNAGNNVYRSGAAAPQGMPGQPQMPGAPGAGGQNAGEHLQAALDYYKQALLSDPANEDAKYNYEFVKRQLEEQQQQQQQDENQQDEQNENEDNQQQDQDGEQNSEQNQNGDQQNQDEQQQEQNPEDGQNQQQDQQEQQQQQEQMDPNQLSRAEAERILQAFQNEEEQLLREVLKPQTRPKKVERDW